MGNMPINQSGGIAPLQPPEALEIAPGPLINNINDCINKIDGNVSGSVLLYTQHPETYINQKNATNWMSESASLQSNLSTLLGSGTLNPQLQSYLTEYLQFGDFGIYPGDIPNVNSWPNDMILSYTAIVKSVMEVQKLLLSGNTIKNPVWLVQAFIIKYDAQYLSSLATRDIFMKTPDTILTLVSEMHHCLKVLENDLGFNSNSIDLYGPVSNAAVAISNYVSNDVSIPDGTFQSLNNYCNHAAQNVIETFISGASS